jgi:hypothetical protein
LISSSGRCHIVAEGFIADNRATTMASAMSLIDRVLLRLDTSATIPRLFLRSATTALQSAAVCFDYPGRAVL